MIRNSPKKAIFFAHNNGLHIISTPASTAFQL